MPLVREDRRFFVGEILEEKSQMKRYSPSHSDKGLLPSGEIAGAKQESYLRKRKQAA